MLQVSLRDYREADLPTLYALDQVCFPPGIAYSPAELRGFLHHPSSFTAVACGEDAILGFAIVRPTHRPSRSPGLRNTVAVLHLLTIDVGPAARRMGVGSLLMRWVLAKAEALRSRLLVLEVAIDNHAAQLFYLSFGFHVTGTIPGYYNDATDALELELDLG